MKTFVLSILFLTITVFSAATGNAADYKEINNDELTAMITDPAPEVIIDMRAAGVFKAGHIMGAVNMPYGGDAEPFINKLKPNETVVLVCYGGVMSAQLAGILAHKNYTKVNSLAGGMGAWRGERVTGK